MRFSKAWSCRGIQAIIESPSAMGVSHIVISAVYAFGVVKFTTADHYLQFISETLDIMDAFPNMKGFHIVMDNAPIHSPDATDPIIKGKGHIPFYLPPYSPEQNPIEIFWKVLKDRVKRGKLSDLETLTSRVIEGNENVSIEHLQIFIQHSIDISPKFLNK
ncbi:hypothetical protein K501DRAFT_279464 [Backusella circina FSU 941]|nr:hypothetical protein K501DRAFT_279464 [Backusella circina FSU 941]